MGRKSGSDSAVNSAEKEMRPIAYDGCAKRPRGDWLHWLSFALTILAFCWVLLCLRAGDHLREGARAERAGQMLVAAREYESAIGSYAPLNPYSKRAALSMRALAGKIRESDPLMSGEITDRLKRAVVSTRWLAQPYREILAAPEVGGGERAIRDPNPLWFFLSLACLFVALGAWWFPGLAGWKKPTACAVGLVLWGLLLYLC